MVLQRREREQATGRANERVLPPTLYIHEGVPIQFDTEIGVSTQKLYARGLMVLDEITTYKWLIRDEGRVRA